jgi:transcription elongation factor Elf1
MTNIFKGKGISIEEKQDLDAKNALIERYKCSFCGKMYKNEFYAKLHENRHKNDTFKCKYCDLTFLSYNLCQKHERFSHVYKKVYTCGYCHHRFVLKCRYNEHLLSHQLLQCSYCPEKFKNLFVKTMHEYSHFNKQLM